MINRNITWDKVKSYLHAALVGRQVSAERVEARLKICSDCELIEFGDPPRCSVCQCRLAGSTALPVLTKYEETKYYGCKYPDGSRWKKAGV